MIFKETKLSGAYSIELEAREDQRGIFARAWCKDEFEEAGLVPEVAQANVSVTKRKGTIRGMHYQVAPHEETKTVRCTRGAIFDVIIDLRAYSDTYLQWVGYELTDENYRMLYVPRGFAHGFVTLTDNVEVTYLVSESYAPGSERGVRYDDPAFKIEWPVEIQVVSDKDSSWPDFAPSCIESA